LTVRLSRLHQQQCSDDMLLLFISVRLAVFYAMDQTSVYEAGAVGTKCDEMSIKQYILQATKHERYAGKMQVRTIRNIKVAQQHTVLYTYGMFTNLWHGASRIVDHQNCCFS